MTCISGFHYWQDTKSINSGKEQFQWYRSPGVKGTTESKPFILVNAHQARAACKRNNSEYSLSYKRCRAERTKKAA
jgi:hypothetical protein